MSQAEHLIIDNGLRATQARTAVLTVLLNAGSALSHAEIQDHLQDLDRVTLYRVLDWLVDHHLVHSITGQDRARRFQVSQPKVPHQHAHFKCIQCGKVFCLDAVSIKQPEPLPRHFTVDSVELNIHGHCADCSAIKK